MAKKNIVEQKYQWLMDTLYKNSQDGREGLTREQIMDKYYQDTEQILKKRTFHNWVKYITEDFNIPITCDINHRYTIDTKEYDHFMKSFLGKTLFAERFVNDLLKKYPKANQRLVIEQSPKGKENLEPIVQAIHFNKRIQFDYIKYDQLSTKMNSNLFDSSKRIVNPEFVKMFNRRWYLVAHEVYNELRAQSYDRRTFALDRMENIEILDEKFEFDKDINPKTYFKDVTGVYVAPHNSIQDIYILAKYKAIGYLNSLPLHASQEIVEVLTEQDPKTNKATDLVVYRIHAKITDDLKYSLLQHGAEVIVLWPESLRLQIKKEIYEMQNNYQMSTDKYLAKYSLQKL